jgi:hypothetical protein
MRYRDKTEQCPFMGGIRMFPQIFEHLKPKKSGLYNISAQFFQLAAQGIGKLRGVLKLEVILGDGYAVMDAIRLKTLTRRDSFPVLFDRIHASNVPDYV